jgi:hypothetical protein
MAMRMPVFHVPLFKDDSKTEHEFTYAALREMLEALVKVDVMWLASHPREYVPLYSVPGLRYRAQNAEDWLSIPEIYKAVSKGDPVDCKCLATARAAELRFYGTPGLGRVHAIADTRGDRYGDKIIMHAFVRFPDGSVEDPSTRLGMKGPGGEGWERTNPVGNLSLLRRRGAIA